MIPEDDFQPKCPDISLQLRKLVRKISTRKLTRQRIEPQFMRDKYISYRSQRRFFRFIHEMMLACNSAFCTLKRNFCRLFVFEFDMEMLETGLSVYCIFIMEHKDEKSLQNKIIKFQETQEEEFSEAQDLCRVESGLQHEKS